MERIAQKDLRNDSGGVLRRAEGGETLAVTVSGRPVAQIGPLAPSSWVPAQQAAGLWATPAPSGVLQDLDGLGAEPADPFSA